MISNLRQLLREIINGLKVKIQRYGEMIQLFNGT